jgi:transposase
MKAEQRSSKAPAAKLQALRRSGTLHPRAAKVQDRLFLEESFFDPQDLTQVKYEMLRRVQKDEMPISMVATSFGVSRPAFYKAQQDFAREGLAGLIARRRGPKQGHKLTGEVLAFVEHIRAQEPGVTTPELVRRIQKKFSIQVHRRTVERALASAKKNRASHSCRKRLQAIASGGDTHRALRNAAQLRACTEQLVQDEVIQLMGAAVMTLVSGGSL